MVTTTTLMKNPRYRARPSSKTSSVNAEGCVPPWKTVWRAIRGGEASVAMSSPVFGFTLMNGNALLKTDN